MRKKNLLTRLAGKGHVFKLELSQDEDGFYFPACLYHRHRGIPTKPERCIDAGCPYLHKNYMKVGEKK